MGLAPGRVLSALEKHLKQHMKQSQKAVDKWAEHLQNPTNYFAPAYHFEWGETPMQHAVRIKVCGIALDHLLGMPKRNHPTNPMTTQERLVQITGLIRRRLEDKAKYPSRCTSQMTNLVQMYETQTWAELCADVADPWSLSGIW